MVPVHLQHCSSGHFHFVGGSKTSSYPFWSFEEGVKLLSVAKECGIYTQEEIDSLNAEMRKAKTAKKRLKGKFAGSILPRITTFIVEQHGLTHAWVKYLNNGTMPETVLVQSRKVPENLLGFCETPFVCVCPRIFE